jgi:aspartate ammonia-lyase
MTCWAISPSRQMHSTVARLLGQWKNFRLLSSPLTINHFPHLINALAMVKQAAARTNCKLRLLSGEKAAPIDRICTEILSGQWHDQFVVDAIQVGAGTSTNMNMNEVIANRASQLCNEALGSYQTLHPNNDVNLSQSTNDAYATAVRLSILLDYGRLTEALDRLSATLKIKADEFADVIKLGRTQLQDVVPMTLGQSFHAFHTTLKEESYRIGRDAALFLEVNLGATAIGTGLNPHPDYAAFIITELAEISGQELQLAEDLIEATSIWELLWRFPAL